MSEAKPLSINIYKYIIFTTLQYLYLSVVSLFVSRRLQLLSLHCTVSAISVDHSPHSLPSCHPCRIQNLIYSHSDLQPCQTLPPQEAALSVAPVPLLSWYGWVCSDRSSRSDRGEAREVLSTHFLLTMLMSLLFILHHCFCPTGSHDLQEWPLRHVG